MLVDTLLGPEDDSAALSASEMPTETSSTVLSPVPAFSLGQFTVQGDQTCSSGRVSAGRVGPVNNDAASLPTPIQGLQAGSLNPQAGSNSEHADFYPQRIGELQQVAAGAASAGPPGAAPGAQPVVLQRNESVSSQMSSESSQSHPLGNGRTPHFRWGACRNLIATDAAGVLVRQPTIWPAVQLGVQLQLPLLYWAEHNRWMWHKKWTLPKLRVLVSCDGKPVGGRSHMFPGDEPPVYAVVSAGTLRDGSDEEGNKLYDQGLSGECQRTLVAGEATFSSLLFRHTSFNCSNRPFHLVVAVHAPAHHPLAVVALRRGEATLMPNTAADGAPSQQQMVSLACSCSSPIIVDARKRTKGERPEADASDVRLVQRQRGTLAHPQKLSLQPQPSMQQGQLSMQQDGHGAQGQGWQPSSGVQPQGGWASQAACAGGEGLGQCSLRIPAAAQGQLSVPGAVNPAAQATVAALPSGCGGPGALAAGGVGDAPIFEACGDAVIELCDRLVVTRLLGQTAFGYEPPELVGASVMSIVHPSDHQPFMQTAQALLAMAAGTGKAAAAPQAVRTLHRVFFKHSATAEVQVDSIITAVRSTQESVPPKLIMASRCALPPVSFQQDDGKFRVYPAGVPQVCLR